MKIRVIKKTSSYFKKFGNVIDRDKIFDRVLVRFAGQSNALWFNLADVQEVPDLEKQWKLGQHVLFNIGSKEITGYVSYVGSDYLKLKVAEGYDDLSGREVVRDPAKVHTVAVTERTQHILFYTNAGGSACNKTFDSMDELKEFVIVSRGFTQMRYRTETVRTTPLKEIKIKTSYEF